MAGMWIRAGSVSVTSGSKKVIGSGTGWVSVTTNKPAKGHTFWGPDTNAYEIDYVESDTVLYLADSYSGPSVSGQPYRIDNTRDSSIPALSRKVSEFYAYQQGYIDALAKIVTGSGDVIVDAPDGQQVTVPALSNMLSKSGNLAGLGDKATARANIGAAPAASPDFSGDAAIFRNGMRLPSSDGALTRNAIDSGTGDGATEQIANLQIKSWYGIGFANLCFTDGIPVGENAVWIDVRRGWIAARYTPELPYALTRRDFVEGFFTEGIFTPSLSIDGVGVMDLSLNKGFWQKRGNQVTVHGVVYISDVSDFAARLVITSLPFVCNDMTENVYPAANCQAYYCRLDATMLWGTVVRYSASIDLHVLDRNGDRQPLYANMITQESGAHIRFSATYRV